MISFSVEGTPIQQGSMKFIRPGVMIHSRAEELAVWRSNIANAAQKAGCTPIDLPIAITLTFRVKKPKTVKRQYPTVAPDLDKYIRAVLDGLTNTAYLDDSQVIQITASKVYAENPGVDIQVSDAFDCL